jgi:ABC-2 type transport system ATP-binding protein
LIVEAQGLSVQFPGGVGGRRVRALDAIDLGIAEGEFFALLGLNGAGKSTAINCFLGMVRPTSGVVRVLGSAPRPGSPMWSSVGFLPEEPHYHDYLTVDEALEYYGGLTRNANWRNVVAPLIERLGLGEYRSRRLSRCSKGVKQKVGIVQCLLGEPRVLFLDEPMRGLDPLAVREFREVLLDRQRQGVTVVMNSHLLAEVESLADRAGILDRGRLLAQGRIADLVTTDPENYVVEVATRVSLPEYFLVAEDGADTVTGTVAARHFRDFVEFTHQNAVTILRCELRRATLEEAFVNILKRAPADA